MQVLVIEVGNWDVRVFVTGESEAHTFPSGPTLTPRQMVIEVKKTAANWNYDVVSIGYPGLVLRHRVVMESRDLGRGWVSFDYEAAFGRPVEIISCAAMQALGSYKGGQMLFLCLETRLGSALVANDNAIPLELGQLPYKKGTFEDYLGLCGMQRLGKKKWRHHVASGVARLIAALHADDVVIGGWNARKLKQLPAGCRAYDDDSGLLGGCRLWEHVGNRQPPFYGRFVQNNHRRQKDNGYGSYTRTNYREAPAH